MEHADDAPENVPGYITSQLDTICGWLSHLDQRLKSLEQAVRQTVRDEVLASESRLASWVEYLENRPTAAGGELFKQLEKELEHWEERAARVRAALEED